MRISVDFKPTRIEARDYKAIRQAVSLGCQWVSDRQGNRLQTYRHGSDGPVAQLFSLEKRRKKVERNGRETKIVKRAHWVAHVYTINVATLKALGIRIIQRDRFFELVPV